MGRKRTRKTKEPFRLNFLSEIKPETRRRAATIGLFLLAVFLILSSLKLGGMVGDAAHSLLFSLFGHAFVLVPLFVLLYAVMHLRARHIEVGWSYGVSSVLFVLGMLGLFDVIAPHSQAGGIIGGFIRSSLVGLFEVYITVAILVAIIAVTGLVIFETSLALPPGMLTFWTKLFRRNQDEEEYEEEPEEEEEEEYVDEDEEEYEEEPEEEEEEVAPKSRRKGKKAKIEEPVDDDIAPYVLPNREYVYPPLSLLNKSKGKPAVGDIKASQNIIKRTLQNFNINVEVDEIAIGPTVTRFALKPAEGVKLSRIVGLQNELSLALAAHPIRIEAPIPGKSLVGIEIPNKSKTMLGLGSIFAENTFQKASGQLVAALGKGVSGNTYVSNIAKMPHLLIAGATGAGKSVTVHTIIASLLYRNSPEQLRFIMVDPKRVELTLYNKIPHLLTPVIKTPKKAILALKWAAKEMERRYDLLESETVRDIGSYHENIVKPAYENYDEDSEEDSGALPEKMPYIVIILDELADIMQAYPKELESAIVRLAQMSRAVGIHLILSTQRPEVNVITGLIKANVPGRIALRVASQIDSRTILDASGAEKLLGAGDMLFQSGNMAQPVRMQCAYISEDEVKKVVKFIHKNFADVPPDEIELGENLASDNSMFSTGMGGGNDDGDELYGEARLIVTKAGKASTSYLQRKLRVGYARAARLMDMLEEQGVIGPANGSKPREVLQNPEDDMAAAAEDEGELNENEEYDEEYEEDEDGV